jgi:hypothetical protein
MIKKLWDVQPALQIAGWVYQPIDLQVDQKK